MDSRKGHATQGVTYRYGWGSGGERGIRTPDTLPGTPDFESGAFSRSASSPERRLPLAIDHQLSLARLLDPAPCGRLHQGGGPSPLDPPRSYERRITHGRGLDTT